MLIVTKSDLKSKVLSIVSKIPKGGTMTYKQVAELAGRPKACRAVGNILNKNYNPKIPCYRVVRSDGKPGGYNRGARKKIMLLKREGVKKSGRDGLALEIPMNINSLRYPNKSHRKFIKFPRNSAPLAEFLGIEFGDGGIGNPWQVVITLNSKKDREYVKHIVGLLHNLFGIDAAVRKRKNENALQLVSSSTTLVDFLVTKGAVRGNKIAQHFDIPEWIHERVQYEKAFVRGLMDTDGCLYIHKHTTKGILYKNIGLCFTSGSKNLLNSVADIFRKFGIEPHITDKERRIYLYDKDSVIKYLRTFGSANPRILEKYKEWKGA